jgi:hypothetical protein
VLAGLGDAAGTPHEPGQADDQGDAVGAQGVHVVLELVADDRELGQGGVQHPLLQGGVAAEQETERGHEDQQQGKQGKEAVPGQQGGEIAALVVAELLDHGEQEPEPAMALLVAIDAAKRSLNRVHTARLLAG